jgi:hypothetical protein
MKVIAKERETARLFFDHYRSKVASLSEELTPDAKKQE